LSKIFFYNKFKLKLITRFNLNPKNELEQSQHSCVSLSLKPALHRTSSFFTRNLLHFLLCVCDWKYKRCMKPLINLLATSFIFFPTFLRLYISGSSSLYSLPTTISTTINFLLKVNIFFLYFPFSNPHCFSKSFGR
jgi:hypothetical protein